MHNLVAFQNFPNLFPAVCRTSQQTNESAEREVRDRAWELVVCQRKIHDGIEFGAKSILIDLALNV